MSRLRDENHTLQAVVLARATKDWLNYHLNTNKEYVISESSLKLPISDYLAHFPGVVQVEKDIESFEDRKFDVYAHIDDREIFIELKYVQADYTRKTAEKQRVYDDLLRLSSVAKSKKRECYVLICGPKRLFNSEFQNLGEKPQSSNSYNGWSPKAKGKVKQKKIGFYKMLFDFISDSPKFVDCSCSTFKKQYEKFKAEYKLSALQKGKSHKGSANNFESFYKSLSNIKITKIALLSEETDIAALGLWRVERA